MTQSALRSVWRLDSDGTWQSLGATVDELMAPLAEMVTMLVTSELGRHVELSVEYEDQTLEVRGQGESTTALLRNSNVHPLVIKTALQRVELASARLSMPVATPVPSRRPAPVRAIRLDDDVELDVIPSFRAATSGQRQMTATKGGPLMTESEDVYAFEIEGFANTTAADGGGAVSCTWGEAARWIESAVKATAAVVGRSVASNYWRELVQADPDIAGRLRVTWQGSVIAADADLAVDPRLANQLRDIQERWMGRCARVIPGMKTGVAGGLGPSPWSTVSPH